MSEELYEPLPDVDAYLERIGIKQVKEPSLEFLDELIAAVEVVRPEAESASGRGTVCFTGKMPEKRAWYESIAKAAGYEPVDSVTDALALLVAADPNASSTKISDAKRLSIPIQSLDLWLGSVKNFVPKKEEPDNSDQMTFDF